MIPSSLFIFFISDILSGSHLLVNEITKSSILKRKQPSEIPEGLKILKHEALRNSIDFIEIPYSLKSRIVGLALDSVINVIQHLTSRPMDPEISQGLVHLHEMCYKKLNDLTNNDKYNLEDKISDIRSVKPLEFDHMAVLTLDICCIYSKLYDEKFLLPILNLYQNLTEKSISIFTNEIRDEYFLRFWKGRILKIDQCISQDFLENYNEIKMIFERNQKNLEYLIYNTEESL